MIRVRLPLPPALALFAPWPQAEPPERAGDGTGGPASGREAHPSVQADPRPGGRPVG